MDEEDKLVDIIHTEEGIGYDNYAIGCLECGTIFGIEDLFGGGCPVCESKNIATFEETLTMVIAHREFMESMGLEETE